MRAAVLVPAKSADAIIESGKPLVKTPGVKFLRMDGERAVLEVEAGSYRFGTTVKNDGSAESCQLFASAPLELRGVYACSSFGPDDNAPSHR